MSQRKCRYCLYWNSRLPSGIEAKDETVGECRVNPPGFSPPTDARKLVDKRGAWPETFGADWCGQFALDRWPQSRAGYPKLPNVN